MIKQLFTGVGAFALLALAGCGGASATYSASTLGPPVEPASSIPENELDPRFSHDDSVAIAQWDRYERALRGNTHAGHTESAGRTTTAAEPAAPMQPSPPAPSPVAEPTSLESSSDSSGATPEENYAAQCSGNCDAVANYRDQICELSARICRIANEHPEHTDIRSRCTDSEYRCELATDRARSCTC